TAQMRFCFVSNSDRAYFSVIQEDSSGRSVAFDEVTGVPGDSYWSWIARSIVVHPVPGASRMRIRFQTS
ncbi:MAG TPA: hypothetical protein VFH29_05550, partial [Anaerolineales bacterium]|nr:hypothetical protein [Anaerolineales bacterium]